MKRILLWAAVLYVAVLPAQNFTEEFEDSATVAANGWSINNNSNPAGSISWFQGNTTVFSAHSMNGYYAANYNSASDTGTISNWLLSPNRWYQNGDSVIFYTRTVDSSLVPTFPDRLQVRFSQNGTSVNCGVTETDLGDFTQLLLDINPTYDSTGYPNGYPCHWRKYTIVLSGLPGPGVSGRFAFRYFVEFGGPLGWRSDYIGIDSVAYRSITNGFGETDAVAFKLFPNPAISGSSIQIQMDHSMDLESIEILDVRGTRVYFTNADRSTESLYLPMLPTGVYSLRLVFEQGVGTRRLIIK